MDAELSTAVLTVQQLSLVAERELTLAFKGLDFILPAFFREAPASPFLTCLSLLLAQLLNGVVPFEPAPIHKFSGQPLLEALNQSLCAILCLKLFASFLRGIFNGLIGEALFHGIPKLRGSQVFELFQSDSAAHTIDPCGEVKLVSHEWRDDSWLARTDRGSRCS